MLSVVMLNVTYKTFMLNVVMLSVAAPIKPVTFRDQVKAIYL